MAVISFSLASLEGRGLGVVVLDDVVVGALRFAGWEVGVRF